MHVRAMKHKSCDFGDSTSGLNALIVAFKTVIIGKSPAVQWLGLGALAAGAPGSIPGPGAKITQAPWLTTPHKKMSLYNIKVNGKIYANNFRLLINNFSFFFT